MTILFPDCYDPAGASHHPYTTSTKKSIVVVGADGSSTIHHIGGNDVLPRGEKAAGKSAGQDEETSSTSSSSSIPESARFSPAHARKLYREMQPPPMATPRGRKFRKEVTPPAPSSSSLGLGGRTASAGDLTGCDRCFDPRRPVLSAACYSTSARQSQEEVSSLRAQLEHARRSIAAMEREQDLYYAESMTSSTAVYDVQNGDCRPAGLVRKFGELYSIARLDALDALDAIADLDDATELKGKLLFSVVVVCQQP